MTIKYIKIVLVISFFLNCINCKSQQFPLNTDYTTIPDYSHLKDFSNELTPFIGTYKANYQGNETTLYITKIENKFENGTKKKYYMDALAVKYTIKNSNGTILQDTKNNNTEIELYSIGTMPEHNVVVLYYSGTNCNVGWGKVYLLKKNTTQIKWDYRPNSSLLDTDSCPGNPDTTVYLPISQDLIFTKQ